MIIRLFNPDFESGTSENICYNEKIKNAEEVKFNEKTLVKELGNNSDIKLDNIAKCHALSIKIKN